jgi:hypothetical protein
MDLVTLADVRALIGHLPKETRARDTWQHVEAELKKAAAGGDMAQMWVALQMVLMLEKVDYRLKSQNVPAGSGTSNLGPSGKIRTRRAHR